MYTDLIKRIAGERKRYGLAMQSPATEMEIQSLLRESTRKLNYNIDSEYETFLRSVNGLTWNGFLVYATTKMPIVGRTDTFIDGFVDTNLAFREVDIARELVVFAEGGDDQFVFNIRLQKFAEIDRVSLDVYEEFESCSSLLHHVLRRSLEE